MKILLLGSLISAEEMEKLNNNSKEKASIAPVNYETMLVKGLLENGAEIEALSVPAVAAYPNSTYKMIQAKKETLFNKTEINWLPFINIQLLKQVTIQLSTYRELKKWLQVNREINDKVVMMYSIYPPYSNPAIGLCKKYHCQLNAVITDLPEYMYTWKGNTGIKGIYAHLMQIRMLSLQGACNSYILFTKTMAKRMKITNKPYIISEGLCDVSIYDGIEEQKKYDKTTLVYAGNLSQLYGIKSLIAGFIKTKGDYELHIYGAGADSKYIEKYAKYDPRIKYLGQVERYKVLVALKKSHLIIINKPTSDDYSNYSFSSKILECMSSGTPILTTKVGGMPKEYYEYFYFINEETPEGIAKVIEETLERNDLQQMGKKARDFAISKKNYKTMTQNILEFLKTNCNGRSCDE